MTFDEWENTDEGRAAIRENNLGIKRAAFIMVWESAKRDAVQLRAAVPPVADVGRIDEHEKAIHALDSILHGEEPVIYSEAPGHEECLVCGAQWHVTSKSQHKSDCQWLIRFRQPVASAAALAVPDAGGALTFDEWFADDSDNSSASIAYRKVADGSDIEAAFRVVWESAQRAAPLTDAARTVVEAAIHETKCEELSGPDPNCENCEGEGGAMSDGSCGECWVNEREIAVTNRRLAVAALPPAPAETEGE